MRPHSPTRESCEGESRNMSERDLLLRAILDNPADDIARLVYADWLQENGQEGRAHVVRDMVQRPGKYYASTWVPHFGHAVRETDDARLRVLDWLCGGPADDELFSIVGGCCQGLPGSYVWERQSFESVEAERIIVLWKRGFIAEVKCSAAMWLAHGSALLTFHPVESVQLTTAPESTGNINLFSLWKRMRKGEPWRSHRWPGVAFELRTFVTS
jgi:uncharacterized protein (TIGR02996 family)